MTRIQVLIVDDTAAVRHILSDILESDPDIEVAAMAADGEQGLRYLERVPVDLVVLDVEMPRMDGLEMLRRLRVTRPHLPVLVFSSITERGAMVTIEALSLGASDYVTKPAMTGSPAAARAYIRDNLLERIHALVGALRPPSSAPPDQAATTVSVRAPAVPRRPARPPELIVIGVSMGGPNALGTVLSALPADLETPVLIVQHMPALFLRALAKRLNGVGPLPVGECQESEPALPGRVWLAAGDRHMEVEEQAGEVRVRPMDGEPVNFCRPSVDTLFTSAAQVLGDRTLAVVMTGMGHDGLEGARHIHNAGGRVLVQDENSSVVWGMGRAVVDAGLADGVVSLERLAPAIVEQVRAGTKQGRVQQPEP